MARTPEFMSANINPDNKGGGPDRKKLVLAFLAGALVAGLTHLPWLLTELGIIGKE